MSAPKHVIGITGKCIHRVEKSTNSCSGSLYSSGGKDAPYNTGENYTVVFKQAKPNVQAYNFYVDTWKVNDYQTNNVEYDYIDVFGSETGLPNSWSWKFRAGGQEHNMGNLGGWKWFGVDHPYVKFCWQSPCTGAHAPGGPFINDQPAPGQMYDGSSIADKKWKINFECKTSALGGGNPAAPTAAAIAKYSGSNAVEECPDFCVSQTEMNDRKDADAFFTNAFNSSDPANSVPASVAPQRRGKHENGPVSYRNIFANYNYNIEGKDQGASPSDALDQVPFNYTAPTPYTIRQRVTASYSTLGGTEMHVEGK